MPSDTEIVTHRDTLQIMAGNLNRLLYTGPRRPTVQTQRLKANLEALQWALNETADLDPRTATAERLMAARDAS